MARGLVECKACDAIYEPFVAHVMESHGLPKGAYPVCPYCGHMSTVRGVESDKKPKAPRDLGYAKMKPYPTAISDPKTVELVDVFAAFRTNVLLLESLRWFPTHIGFLARLWQQLKDEELLAQYLCLTQPKDADRDVFNNALAKRLGEWFSDNSPEAKKEYAERYGGSVLRDFGAPELWRGTHSMLVAQITSAWTAFEALAGDLWIAAVNCHPETLAQLGGTKNRIAQDSVGNPKGETDEGIGAIDEKTVKLEWLWSKDDRSYDLSKKMGTILSQRFRFSTLEDIRRAYSQAFPKQHSKVIDSALADSSIDLLQAVRNLFAHRGGIVDAQYEGRLAKIPNAPKCERNKRLPLDGKMTEELVNPVLQVCHRLLGAVDTWLQHH